MGLASVTMDKNADTIKMYTLIQNETYQLRKRPNTLSQQPERRASTDLRGDIKAKGQGCNFTDNRS